MERLNAADAAEAAPNGPAAARSEPSAAQAAKVPLPPQADAVTKRTAGRTRKSAAPAKLVCDHRRQHCVAAVSSLCSVDAFACRLQTCTLRLR